jgi:hypothetical protein
MPDYDSAYTGAQVDAAVAKAHEHANDSVLDATEEAFTSALKTSYDGKIAADGVTFENLDANGDIGTGAAQVAAGDHAHSGTYEPADADIAKTDEANEYTAAQNFNATALTDAANIAWDLAANQVASVTLEGSRTLDNPTNMVDGATYMLTVKQDATGSRTLAYGTAYKWPGGTAPTLSTGANAVDILSFVSDGASMFGVASLDFS